MSASKKNSCRPIRKPVAHATALLVTLCTAQFTLAADDVSQQTETLDKVVVTAQKREQAAIDVPASVSAISADRLTRGGLDRFEDYAAQIPGMSVTALTRGFSSVVLRGISTGISQATPSTAYYIDEAPIGSVNAYATGSTLTPDIDPYDLRRIEVLKGPQGTLYGAGAVGGLVRFVSVPADTEKFGGSVSVGMNSVADGGTGSEERAALNIPLADKKMGLRMSLMNRVDAGYIDNPVLGEKDVNKARTHGGRLAWNWNINDDWNVQVWGQTQRFHSGGIGVEDQTAPALTPATGNLQHSSYIHEDQNTGLDVMNATVKGRLGDVALTSSTTYQKLFGETHVDNTALIGPLLQLTLGIPNVGAELNQHITTKRWSQELRARTSALGDKLQYEGGLFFTKEDSSNFIPPIDAFNTATGAAFPLGVPVANARIDSTYKEYSLFGNATYSLSDKFDVTAGLRYAHDQQHYLQDYKLSLLTAVPVLIDQSVSHSKATYLVSGIYKPDANTSIYGRIATGYRPGGPSALPPGVVVGGKTSFEPDTLTSYELGFKSSFAGGRASLEAAVFTTDWKDVQIQTSARTVAGNFNYFVNGGNAKSNGLETTFMLAPSRDLLVRTTVAYTDSHLTEDAPAAGGLNGDRMPFTPRLTSSLAIDYHFGVAGYAAWLGGSYNYIGARRSNFSGKTPFEVGSYNTFNLSSGIDIGPVRLSVYGKNLANSRGVNFMNSSGLALPGLNPFGNPYVAGIIQPRTIGMDLAYRF